MDWEAETSSISMQENPRTGCGSCEEEPVYEEGTREALYEISVIPVTFEQDWRQVHRLTGS